MSLFSNFCDEVDTQEGIIKYLEVCCFEEEYNRVSHLLERPVRPLGDVYSENVEFISELKSKCNDIRDNISVSYTEIYEWPEWLCGVDHREPLGELIDLCVEYLDNGVEIDIDEIKEQIELCNKEAGEEYYTEEHLRKALIAAPLVFVSNNNSKLEEQEDAIARLLATVDMVDITRNTNIYRQSFISIFSIFDAYVFDCLKKYFVLHAGELENFFTGSENEKIKLTYEKAIAFADMEALKNDYVEQKFDGKYIKQILVQIKNKYPNVLEGIEYKNIMEMVNRRNIHIHNQGVADARYIENFNILGLEINDYAQISKQYFLNAVAILKKIIQNIESEFLT